MSKFSVGEVCLALVDKRFGMPFGGKWVTTTVVKVGVTPKTYVVDFILPGHEGDLHISDEDFMRKLHPPQTDTQTADEDFIKDLRGMIFKDEVEA